MSIFFWKKSLKFAGYLAPCKPASLTSQAGWKTPSIDVWRVITLISGCSLKASRIVTVTSYTNNVSNILFRRYDVTHRCNSKKQCAVYKFLEDEARIQRLLRHEIRQAAVRAYLSDWRSCSARSRHSGRTRSHKIGRLSKGTRGHRESSV